MHFHWTFPAHVIQGSSVEIPQIFLAKILSESSFQIPSAWKGCNLTYTPTNMQPENGQPESEKIPWKNESKKGWTFMLFTS